MSVFDMNLNTHAEALDLELWEMLSTLKLQSLPDPLWLGVVACVKVLTMGQIELFYKVCVKKWSC